jgi:MEMO1 family protein
LTGGKNNECIDGIENIMLRRIIFIFLIVIGSAECRAQIPILDRQPAVAGTFYPADKNELIFTLADLFTHAVPSKNITDVVAIIAPHAGYIFSGSVAASSFNQIDPEKEYDNIFVIGSSHYVSFDGASIYRKGNFITPLGTVKVNTKLAGELIAKYPFFNDRDDAHAKEHCIEVELPFLQYRMKKDFRIVPIVIGTKSPDVCLQIADALRPYCTPKNLFIFSTDFSHYPAYDDAVKVDAKTAAAVCTNSVDKFISVLRNNAADNIPDLATSMCGWTSVLTFLYIVQGNPAFTFDDIQYKNSGDSPSGDKKRVVGYHAIVISRKNDQSAESFHLTDADKKNLLSLARRTVESYVTKHEIPDVGEDSISKNLLVKCGAFVTLNKNGVLRGCIGRFDATEPLYKVVRSMAIAAATQDVRFPEVAPDEISHLQIEISVLTPMRKISSIDEFDTGKDGIYMKKGTHAGTFLPQVAKETGWSKEELLGHCAQDKAGIGWDGWKNADLYIYEALVFGENP